MKRISLRKKLAIYFSYRRALLRNKELFRSKYNLRVDRVNRIYTVINIPESIFEEPYNLRTTDINKISEPYIAEYIKQISILLNDNGMTELYKLYTIDKVEKFSYLIVIGFSLFDTDKAARLIFLKLLPVALIITTLLTLKHFFLPNIF